jgi:hypothetical protein
MVKKAMIAKSRFEKRYRVFLRKNVITCMALVRVFKDFSLREVVSIG